MRLFLSLVVLSFSTYSFSQVKTYEGYPLGVHIVAFSPDGAKLLIGSGARELTMHIFDVEKEERVATIGRQEGGIAFANWLPTEGKFYTSGKDSLKIWSGTDSYELYDFGACDYEGELIAHPEGKLYAIACDKKAYVLDSEMVKKFEVELDEIYSTGAISPNADELVIATVLDEMMIINTNDQSIERSELEGLAKQLNYLSPNELMIVDYYIFKSDEPYVRFLNKKTGEETNFTDDAKFLLAQKIPNKNLVISTHSGGHVKLFKKDGTLVKDFGQLGSFPLSLDVSNDGSKAAVGLLSRLVVIDLSDF
ncbi:WD40 repeat domain-containing protein [Roseivirga misakiensis]|uniref:Anaphase-promoting complex subunit 4 WD40 domain-containing protein n=1 Tax=Roseivirga misakiensis TaxID=1563681 RepID=A0A1E5T6R9_9BACT|nr:WD40 repeat domain-containing protein [Roseivirga misakiensis]OEK06997.1 hypothetical protein BFP71_04885 [Roseivirga misakiensis]